MLKRIRQSRCNHSYKRGIDIGFNIDPMPMINLSCTKCSHSIRVTLEVANKLTDTNKEEK